MYDYLFYTYLYRCACVCLCLQYRARITLRHVLSNHICLPWCLFIKGIFCHSALPTFLEYRLTEWRTNGQADRYIKPFKPDISRLTGCIVPKRVFSSSKDATGDICDRTCCHQVLCYGLVVIKCCVMDLLSSSVSVMDLLSSSVSVMDLLSSSVSVMDLLSSSVSVMDFLSSSVVLWTSCHQVLFYVTN